MKKYIIFSIILLFIFLFSCSEATPPEEEDEYIPTIIYRVESTTHTTCTLIEYTSENGDIVTLNNVNLPWEYQMNIDDYDYVSLHAQHSQIPVITGTADGTSGGYQLIDTSADYSTLDETSIVLNLSNSVLHQIAAIVTSTLLRLNLDTFTGGENYEIYNRMYYTVAIYRIDETEREEPLIHTAQLYSNMDITIDTYAYKK